MTRKPINILILLVLLPLLSLSAQDRSILSRQAIELGKVQWYRDYDRAVEVAKNEGKDILILFQEVPGCATCRNYGHNVLSHPLMVEALENSFVPLAIFNNKPGKDRKILDQFNEPSWNNPVVRIIDANGNDLVKRVSNDYSALTLCKRIIQALNLRTTNIPEYIKLLEQELEAIEDTNLKQKYYKMYCFWTGEKVLGKAEGVLNVEAGFIGSAEVVRMSYNPSVLSEKELDDYAAKNDMVPVAKNKGKEFKLATKDVRYAIQHSDYQYLPLSELQKTKINSSLGSRQNAKKYLSPTQKEWLELIQQNKLTKGKIFFDMKLSDAWELMQGLL